MKTNFTYYFILILFNFSFHQVSSQTLIINEVSNGPNGNKEYVEFLVVSNSVSYDCGSSTPPCIDIRGWIFDDNSGYHGTGGIASGAVRFSQDPIWSCIPLGTIILIYNDIDRNPAIPVDDLSLSDGNCSIIAPISSSLFETNSNTPGAVACSYPASGWTNGGNWNNTLLANPGDCARIVNLSGCEVFSLCWGTDNLNNVIYFNSAGGQTVWFFNGSDPSDQMNWASGSASSTPSGQTPGTANNSLNESYIAQFNNGCLPITPISISTTFVNGGCSCTGEATATANGSIGGYTFEWYDENFISIGQSTATATGLCAGIYKVIGTSSIGCSDTATVTITAIGNSSISVVNQEVCAGESAMLTATTNLSGGDFVWSTGDSTSSIIISPSSTTTYSVNYILSGCNSSASGIVTIKPNPTIVVSDQTVCFGTMVTLQGTGADIYSWDNNVFNNIGFTPLETTIYVVTGTAVNGCIGTDSVTINVIPLPIVNAGPDQTICENDEVSFNGSGTPSMAWNNGVSNGISFIPTSTNFYVLTGADGNGCMDTDTVFVNVKPLPVVSFVTNKTNGCAPLQVQLTNTTPNSTNCSWTINNGNSFNGNGTNSVSFTEQGCYDVTLTATSNGCTNTETIFSFICVDSVPEAIFSPSTFILPSFDSEVNFENFSTDASSYLWDFGDNSSSVLLNPSHGFSVSDTGGFIVKLIAFSTTGCSDTAYCSIRFEENLIFYIPNSFTPDDDDFNQDFKPIFTSGFDPYEFSLFIYNRWGELVFESHNAEVGWNGTYGNTIEMVQDGVYIWKIEYKLKSLPEHELITGHVTLIR